MKNSLSFGSVLGAFLLLHLLITSYATANYVIFNTNLSLCLNPDYFYNEKVGMILGGDYIIAKRLASLAGKENYLIVSTGVTWFINYYLSPRKLFFYEGVTAEADLASVPQEWLRRREISNALVYGPKTVKLVQLVKETKQ